MTPREFVGILDEWGAAGGAFPKPIAHDYAITTAPEAAAVCRALATPRIFAAGGLETPALNKLVAFFQSAETKEAADTFRDQGLPLLRRILSDALDQTADSPAKDSGEQRRTETLLSLSNILAMYGEPGDGPLIIKAARDAKMSDGYLWWIIFDSVIEGHPEALEICEGLRDPLPDGSAGTAYLNFANALSREQRISRHPFDSAAGIARLAAYLADPNSENDGCAVSAAASIPFIRAGDREMLIAGADRHPNAFVRLEAAWALAKTGSEFGWQRLAQLCLNPRFAERAIEYLEELRLGAHIPPKARDPDFRAMARMCSWLRHPSEFGRPPDQIVQYDTRVLNWPPTRDRRRLWLFKYRYEPQGDAGTADEGIGLVGSTTWSFFDEPADLAPEDVYGLHCCWELKLQNDPRIPEDHTAALGRQMLAETNPGFAGA
jgi:hypothetical protein